MPTASEVVKLDGMFCAAMSVNCEAAAACVIARRPQINTRDTANLHLIFGLLFRLPQDRAVLDQYFCERLRSTHTLSLSLSALSRLGSCLGLGIASGGAAFRSAGNCSSERRADCLSHHHKKSS